MADKKLSMTDQRKSIEAAYRGEKFQPSYDVDSQAFKQGAHTLPKTIDLGPNQKEIAEQEEVNKIKGMQDRNLANPAIAAKLQATNDSIKRYNEQMRQKLIGAVQPNPEQEVAPTIGEQFPAMEEDVDPTLEAKKALLLKLAGQGQ